jgi:sec-independent protein translocase protein TatB
MEILNVGPPELLLILVLALIVLGPKDIVSYSKRAGKWLAKLFRSPIWQSIISTSQEIREMPRKLIQESGLQESLSEMDKISQEARNFSSVNVEKENLMTDLPKGGSHDNSNSDHQLYDPNRTQT